MGRVADELLGFATRRYAACAKGPGQGPCASSEREETGSTAFPGPIRWRCTSRSSASWPFPRAPSRITKGPADVRSGAEAVEQAVEGLRLDAKEENNVLSEALAGLTEDDPEAIIERSPGARPPPPGSAERTGIFRALMKESPDQGWAGRRASARPWTPRRGTSCRASGAELPEAGRRGFHPFSARSGLRRQVQTVQASGEGRPEDRIPSARRRRGKRPRARS
ncbi:MAG: hypothetical protein MZU95_04960 [Desulfomicrobium escambiense]|nr:hypothetical protein [Desulfomicrobium escambiense]